MKYMDYGERLPQGTFNFPIAFYHQTPLSPGYEMQYHWHTHYELIRILSGTFHLTLEKITKIYYPGDIIFVSSGIITISCGFNDESYFIKTFHKYRGITPKQFMKASF